ncbi:MAG: substrate-binding domain-containing protein [Acidobacteriota bacterium]|nr:substrate-binding domain-containing protein [Acidobacteriota bacterium]
MFVCFLVVIPTTLLTPAQTEPGYRIVVHPDNPGATITKKELKNIFLKRMAKWPHGEPIIPVDLSLDSSVRKAFTRDIHKRSTTSINAYWQKRLFSGKGVPPSTFREETAVLDYVKNNPGAIGYISGAGDAEGVKILKVIP